MAGLFDRSRVSLLYAHIMHISRLTAEMAVCVESRAGTRLAPDLSNAALQVSINTQELDAEARRVHEIADALICPTKKLRKERASMRF